MSLKMSTDAIIPNSKQKSKNKKSRCKICQAVFKTKESLKKHELYIHSEYKFQCKLCNKCFNRPDNSMFHLMKNHNIAREIHGQYLNRVHISDLEKQEQMLEKELEIPVQQEGLTIVKGSPLKRKTLHLVTKFNCYDCSDSFENVAQLFAHVKNYHKSKDPGTFFVLGQT